MTVYKKVLPYMLSASFACAGGGLMSSCSAVSAIFDNRPVKTNTDIVRKTGAVIKNNNNILYLDEDFDGTADKCLCLGHDSRSSILQKAICPGDTVKYLLIANAANSGMFLLCHSTVLDSVNRKSFADVEAVYRSNIAKQK
ncbi:MAG: hypothetical protein J6R99_02395 [Alphaproteobacteria bacterium]|nr:hypothetical protein [Alphaproteobacteria bacterium]